MAPYFSQAKSVAWDYLRRYSEPLWSGKPNESELRVDLVNGARIRLYGADNPDALRGVALDGVVMDEVADMRPRVWGEVIRPALSDRLGWATFIGTPRGRNSFFDIWQAAQGQQDWYAVMLKASSTDIILASELESARQQMSEDQYAQEYECSFEAAIQGAYYGKDILELETAGRCAHVAVEKFAPVHTAWDLGIGDSTAIWFAQQVGREVRIVDYYEASGVGLDHYAKVLQAKGYLWGEHIVPHDAAVRELGSGKSRIETLAALGIKVRLAPKLAVDDGINAVRMLLPRCWFDKTRAGDGLELLKQYRRAWNEERKTFEPRPLHDHTSHAADAFRYLAVGLKPERKLEPIKYSNAGIV